MTLLRILLAAVFGVMSLGHGPIMAFSLASSNAPHHQPMIDHGGHYHHAGGTNASSESPADVGSVPVCYSAGCFVGLEPSAISAPGAGIGLLGNLVAAPSRLMLARAPGPPDPPPRLQD